MSGTRREWSVGHVNLTAGLSQVAHAMSDGTGRQHDEIRLLTAAAATAVAAAAAVRGVAWVVEATTDVDLWPTQPDRY